MAIITSERMAGGGTGSERSPNCKKVKAKKEKVKTKERAWQ